MVGIIGSDTLGTALSTIGGFGTPDLSGGAASGNSAVSAYANVANGNLVLQGSDGVLAAPGLSVDVLRTYNSQGSLNGGSDWNTSVQNQKLQLIGNVGDSGSTIVRTATDGSQTIYTYDASQQAYTEEDGTGPQNTIVVNSDGTLVRTDGATRGVETYDQTSGRLLSSSDSQGNKLQYAYSGTGQLQSIQDENGEGVSFTYDTNGNLASQTSQTYGDNAFSTTYGYDQDNRLISASVALGNNASFTTSYTYDGDSDRIASVTQSNGVTTSFTYVNTNDQYRIATVTDGLGNVTSYNYNLANNVTAVTDPNGSITQYSYDAAGRITQVSSPAPTAGANPSTVDYSYDANGNLTSSTDADSNVTSFTYDARGNLLTTTDPLGNVVANTWSGSSKLLTQTSIPSGDTEQASTTRSVYNIRDEKSFDISATGGVTAYLYSDMGELVSVISYTGGRFDTSGLNSDQSPSDSDMQAWVQAQDPSQATRTDYNNDFRGLLASKTTYGSLLSNGEGDTNTAITVSYSYSASGQLLSSQNADGDTTQYGYDALGRMTYSADPDYNVTTIQYDDANNAVSVTSALGLTTTTLYNAAGQRVSQTRSDGQVNATTSYQYDANGNVAMSVDPDGDRTFYVYDAQNRVVASVDPTGDVTSFSYDAAGNEIASTQYATVIDTSSFVDSNGKVISLSLADVEPASSSADATVHKIYDADNRVVATVDAAGSVVQTVYGKNSEVLEVIEYAHKLDLTGLGDSIPLSSIYALASADERITQNFYDADGNLSGTLNADGYLTVYSYDPSGHLVSTTAYANPALQPSEQSEQLSDYVPTADPGADVTTYAFYNASGERSAQVDPDGNLTEFVYDDDGQLAKQIAYATPVDPTANSTLASLRPSSSADDQTISYTYNADGQVASETNSRGTITQYTYDQNGNVISTVVGAGTAAARTTIAEYDAFGRMTASLSAEGAAQLTGNQTQDQVEAIFGQYATFYVYDAAGRKIRELTPDGATTLYFYDAAGRLTNSINGYGQVSQTSYDALGRVSQVTSYVTGVDTTGLTGGSVSQLASILATIAIPGGDATATVTYNSDGTRATSTDAIGTVTAFQYDAFGDVVSTTSTTSRGTAQTATATYDRLGQLLQTVSDPTGLNVSQSNTYDAFGRVVRSIDANGNTRSFSYDANGNELTSTDAAGNVTATSYDAFDRVVSQTDAAGQTTRYSYAADGSQMTVTTPDGISVVTRYDQFGSVIAIIDGNGDTTSYKYDLDGNRVETDTAAGTSYTVYDADDRLIETFDANGNSVVYMYNAIDQLVSRIVDPGGLNLETDYSYNSLRQQVMTVDPNGVATSMNYDLDGDIVSKTVDPSGLALTTTWQYDGSGRVTSVTDPNGTLTTYQYDALGRRVQQTVDPDGLDIVTTYSYDANGNMTSSVNGDGVATYYAYDADNRLRYAVDGDGDVSETDYDVDGRVTGTISYALPVSISAVAANPSLTSVASMILPSTTDAKRYSNYDSDGQLIATVTGTGTVTRYTYDDAGNVIDKITYANTVDISTLTAGSPIPLPLADPARDNEVRTVYDTTNRPVYTVDSTGAVVQYVYDSVGNVLERIAYATPILTSTPATASAIASALVSDPAHDDTTTNLYDAANQVVYSVNGVGTVTQYFYDADGNSTGQTVYANALPQGLNLLAALGPLVAFKGELGLSTLFQADTDFPLLVLIAQGQDSNGTDVQALFSQVQSVMAGLSLQPTSNNVNIAISIVNLAETMIGTSPYSMGTDLTSAVNTAIGVIQTIVADGQLPTPAGDYAAITVIQATVNYFQNGGGAAYFASDPSQAPFQAGEAFSESLIAAIPALYDGAMPTAATLGVSSNGEVNATPLAYMVSDSNDRADYITRDAAGRVIENYNAGDGLSTYYYYDADGNVVQVAQVGASYLTITPEGPSAPASQSALVRVTSYVYDAAGRQIYAVGPNGAVTQTQYDSAGNAVLTTQYANIISIDGSYPIGSGSSLPGLPGGGDFPGLPSSGSTSTLAPGDFGYAPGLTLSYIEQNLQPNATADRITARIFDAAGQKIDEVGSSGNVTSYSYDADGRLMGTVAYANTVAVSNDGYTAQSLATALVTDNARDERNTYTYSASGNLLSSTDPTGATETYTYDALGNKLSYTDKNGGTTLYGYDNDGRLVSETSAAVLQTTLQGVVNGSLSTQGMTSVTAAVVTNYAYDAFGNVVSKTEAVGTAQQRTTTYVYDALGRQVKVVYPAVGVYDANIDNLTVNGADGLAARTEDTGVALYTETLYDAFGDAVANRDVAGNISYKIYDGAGNVVSDIDANGYQTTYTRDSFGEVTEQIRGADTVSSPLFGQFVALSSSDVTQTQDNLDRAIRYTYDASGNVVDVKTGSVTANDTYFYDASAGGAADSVWSAAETSTTYNAFGQATLVEKLVNPYTNEWAVTANYYDNRGNMIASVDPMGYVTTMSYDANNNLISETQFATATSTWDASGYLVPVPSAQDRTTDYTYDLDNRKTSETQVGVSFSAADGTTQTGNLTTTYTYDAVGNLTSTTDPTGAVTYTYYDALGRVIATVTPTVNAAGSGAISPLTLYYLDAYGDVVASVAYANGASSASSAGYTTASVSANDHWTLDQYDSHGNETVQTAGGYTTFSSYNAMGKVAKQWEAVTEANGATHTSFEQFQYDAVGNLLEIITPATTSVLVPGAQDVQVSSATISHDESGSPYVNGTNSVSLNWSSLIDPDGGTVQIVVSYNTLSTTSGSQPAGGAIDESGFPVGGTASVAASQAQTFSARSVAGGATVTWTDSMQASGGISSVTSIAVMQQDPSGQWVLKWQGSPSQAVGSSIETVSQAAAGVDTTDMRYDAFGDVITKGTNGDAQQYFTYDTNGNLWSTNSNGGVDQIYAYDMLGNRTAVIQNQGSGGAATFLSSDARDSRGADYITSEYLEPSQVSFYQSRNTITVYDKDGNAVDTISPSQSAYQSDAPHLSSNDASFSVGAAATDESGNVVSNNQMSVHWSSATSIGSGPVKVVVTYQPAVDESGAAVGGAGVHSYTQVFSQSQVSGGTANLSWTTDDSGRASSVGSVSSVTVYQLDASGNWQVLTSQAQAETAAPANNNTNYLSFSTPKDPSASLSLIVATSAGTLTLQGTNFGDQVRFDLGQLPVGAATAQLQYAIPGQPTSQIGQAMSISVSAPTAGQTENNAVVQQVGGLSSSSLTPSIERTFDRWGNMTSSTEARNANWITTYQYNAENKLVSETTPNADGTGTGATTRTYYDADGRAVATRDANGNLNGTVYDAAGNVVKQIHADGGVVTSQYDAFNDQVESTDALGNQTLESFDQRGLETAAYAVVNGQTVLRESVSYDALGDKLTDTNGMGETTTYTYDLRGNVIDSVAPMGQSTQDAYDVNGKKIFEVDPDANAATWTYDSFGQLLSHQDIGGAVYRYSYDAAQQLVSQTNSRGQDLQYSYDAAGNQIQVDDVADNEVTSYSYDLAGNKTHTETVNKGVVVQDEYLGYDADNRLRTVQDGNVDITIDYDANGNRTHMATRYVDGSNQIDGGDLYFGYDAMNRETVADAVDSNLDISATQGDVLTFDKNGNRISDTHGGKEYAANGSVVTGLVTEQYSYDALNRLTQTTYNGVVTDERTYDAGDHVLTSGARGSQSQSYFDALDLDVDQQTNSYNADGQLVTQVDADANGSEKYEVDYNQYDAAGNVLEYTQTTVGSGGYTNTYQYDMERFEGYQVADVRGSSTKLDSGETTYQYDVNGNLVGLTDATDSDNNRTFINDANGVILQKTQGSNVEYELVVNGSVMATTGTGTSDGTTRASSNGQEFINITNFDPSFRPISNTFPAASPGEYTVQVGDTLETIAQASYGDSKLWYLIADANGLSSDKDVRVGQTLSIPNRVTDVHNTASTFKPYSAADVIGNTTPNLPTPSDGGSGCGIIGEIIVVVITAVVAVVSQQYELLAIDAAEMTATEAAVAGIATAAVAGAVGSIAGQLVGDALGVHHGLSLAEVAEEAAEDAVTGGSDNFGEAVVLGAVRDAATQGIKIAVGAQHGFSWKELAVSSLASGVAQVATAGTNVALQNPGDSAVDNFVSSMAGGVVRGEVTNAFYGGKRSFTSIASDAFGNALGSAIGDGLSTDIQSAQNGSATPALNINVGNSGDAVLFGPIGNAAIMSDTYGGQALFSSPDNGAAVSGSPLSQAQPFEFNTGLESGFSSLPGKLYVQNDLVPPGQQAVVSDADAGNYNYITSWSDADGGISVNASNTPTSDVSANAVPYPDIQVSQLPESSQLGTTTPSWTDRFEQGLSDYWNGTGEYAPTTSNNGTFGSAVSDTGHAFYNAGLGVAEVTGNLLSGSLPGSPGYVSFSNDRLPYDTPVFGGAIEAGAGFGIVKAASFLGSTGVRVVSGAGEEASADVNSFSTGSDVLSGRTDVSIDSNNAIAEQKLGDGIASVGGRAPINSRYAGQTYPVGNLPSDMQLKYPNSVRFNTQGFPDFSPYVAGEVEISGLTGNRVKDAAMANAVSGLEATPSGYTWHHVEDGTTMQLVPSDIHDAVRHTGGAAVIKYLGW